MIAGRRVVPVFSRVLVANCGEIAVCVIRGLHELRANSRAEVLPSYPVITPAFAQCPKEKWAVKGSNLRHEG